MADKPIRVGFVGAGANTRKHHIPKLKAQPGVELVAVANRSRRSRASAWPRSSASRGSHGDWREVVEAKDVDAVCIGTWPYTHREMTIAALDAGKHVLCEARMAMNAAEGRRMLEASRKAPQLVAQLVPAPHTLEVDRDLEKLLAEGYAGEIHAVEVQGTQQGRFAELGDAMHWRQDIRAERQQHHEHGHLVRGDDALARPGPARDGHDQDRQAEAQGRRPGPGKT